MPPKVYTKPPFKTTRLFQDVPAHAKYADKHGFKWTTWEGHIAAGRRHAGQLRANERLIAQANNDPSYFYPYDATIKCLDELTVPQIKKLWKTLSGVLRDNNIVAAWTIEVSRANLIDWHLVIRSAPAHLMANRGRKIKALIRKKKLPCDLNIQFRAIPDATKSRRWCNYVVKSKIGGTRKRKPADTEDVDLVENNITYTNDIYKNKRTLFIDKSGLAKHGDIGGFWEKSKADLTKMYNAEKAKRQRITNVVDTAAKRLADLTGHHIDFVTRRLVKEYETFPNDKELRKQNNDLANDWYKSTPEYEEEQDAQRRFNEKINENFDHLLR